MEDPDQNAIDRGKRRTFRLGDKVRILSGPFGAFTGRIEGINQSKALLKIRVEIFGRYRAIKLNFTEVEKIEFSQE
jgi:transcriptional antiterminator NusG